MKKHGALILANDRDSNRTVADLEPVWITIIGCLFLAILFGAGLMAI